MFTKSIWNAYATHQDFFELKKDITVDVAIIGGGITGITTAQLLKEKGLNIAVLEAREVGRGTTSHSTGNLYAMTDQLLESLSFKYDLETVKKVIRARQSALKHIEKNVNLHNLDCDFHKRPMYIFGTSGKKDLAKERILAEEVGLFPTEIEVDFPYESKLGFKIEDQAQINPLLYIQGLANEIEGGTCSIYENTRVREIEDRETDFLLHTNRANVTAKYIVEATHTPKGVDLEYHTILGPYREYGIAAKLESTGNYPEGIFWGYFKDQKYSFRSYKKGEESFLLCIGNPHKVGQAEDNKKYIQDLVEFAGIRFPIKEVVYKWGGQHYKPADLLPYIGRKTSESNNLIATGFSTDGLVYGTLSAIINSEIITGGKNEFEDLFKASRHNPGKAAKKFIKENINVAAEMIKGYLFKPDDEEVNTIGAGEARVIKRDGKELAVYRTPGGELKIFSAVCTHMGCIVNWNNAEKSWDCPCHGTRFDVEGEVLEGPAFDPLKKG